LRNDSQPNGNRLYKKIRRKTPFIEQMTTKTPTDGNQWDNGGLKAALHQTTQTDSPTDGKTLRYALLFRIQVVSTALSSSPSLSLSMPF